MRVNEKEMNDEEWNETLRITEERNDKEINEKMKETWPVNMTRGENESESIWRKWPKWK